MEHRASMTISKCFLKVTITPCVYIIINSNDSMILENNH